MDRARRVFCAAMKIATTRGQRLSTEVDVRQAMACGLEVTYVAHAPVEDVHYVQVRRNAEQLAVLSWDALNDAFQPFPLLPGPWQDALLAEAGTLPVQHFDS